LLFVITHRTSRGLDQKQSYQGGLNKTQIKQGPQGNNPPQVEKAGYRERKGLTNAQAHTQERGKNPQFRETRSLSVQRPRTYIHPRRPIKLLGPLSA
jgi:hypothetical protein